MPCKFNEWLLKQPKEIRNDQYFSKQMEVIRLSIPFAISIGCKEEKIVRNNLEVISTYNIDSIILPVIMIKIEKATFVVKSDLNDQWIISVDSLMPVPKNIYGLNHEIRKIDYFGIPDNMIFGTIFDDQNRFTAKAEDETMMQIFFIEFCNKVRCKYM